MEQERWLGAISSNWRMGGRCGGAGGDAVSGGKARSAQVQGS
jgi:hypothetical protein